MTTMKQLRNMVSATDDGVLNASLRPSQVGFCPSESLVHRYIRGLNEAFDRIVKSMRHPEMVRMAVDLDIIDGIAVGAANPIGYEYVCRRLRHPDTLPAEKRDLEKVVRAYKLIMEYRALDKAVETGDLNRINRIVGNTRGTRA